MQKVLQRDFSLLNEIFGKFITLRPGLQNERFAFLTEGEFNRQNSRLRLAVN